MTTPAPVSADCELIEVHVPDLRRLFNEIDPSPLHEKDLDARVEAFIVSWAREARREARLELFVHVDRADGPGDGPTMVHEAVRQFFTERSRSTARRLRLLLRVGRTSLVIGLVCLTLSVVIGGGIERMLAGQRAGEILRESLLIGGWVAMWRPLEIFLYEWWPVRDDIRLYDRLSAMQVRIAFAGREAAGV
jgi:hypothetical protein